jgi:hypothetical protein
MQTRNFVRMLTAVLAMALLGLLGSGAAALAVPPPDGGSVSPKPKCVALQRLHLGHREQVDRQSLTLCRPEGNQPTFSPIAPASGQPTGTDDGRALVVDALRFVALVAGIVAFGAWRRLRHTRPREAT